MHDVDKAEDAGYVEFLHCSDSAAGGMGPHYVDLSALDDTVDPLHPEAMVYEVKSNGRLSPPSLFGQDFHVNSALNVWVLDAWI